MKTTWRKLIADAMGFGYARGGDPGPIIACTLTEAEMDVEFDSGHKGGIAGRPFTAWTPTRVYFPAQYDGSEWVESVPRDPCDEAIVHVGKS